MTDANVERDPVEVLAEEFVERQRRGEDPSVSEYAAKYPQWADEIRELFPTIAIVERLKAHKEQSGSGRASLGGLKLERLGDYRILREIGRGGMGIVFEAEQESLGRRVAIKVLPRPALLDPRHVKRFEREARIAAGLHHTNIVEVFGVGEQDGLHYYVMQFISGVGLDRIISRLRQLTRGDSPHEPGAAANVAAKSPADVGELDEIIQSLLRGAGSPRAERNSDEETVDLSLSQVSDARSFRIKSGYWRTVAEIGLQVADALHYAHTQGTLHRDIKPANLLRDAHGVVWLSDFGVAKAVQSDNLTHTGDMTGTLRFMAPEQFSGKVDARSDIYSLGLTLYELLTLRPAYDEADRNRLIYRITHGEPAPPRRINPQIPRDLETVILKAISRDPDRRYPSAAALAADLRCFLEDRPIQARRASSVERLWRWSRRNRAVASLAGTTLLLVLLVAIVATAGYVRTKRALEGEAKQREHAEANADLAVEVLDRIFERYSPSPVTVAPELSVEGAEGMSIQVPTPPALPKEAVKLLQDMLAFFDQLAKQLTNDARPREKAAGANCRVGDIRQRLGQYDEAAAAYGRAIDIYRKLAQSPAESTRLNLEIARTQNELGRLYRATGQNDKARQFHLEALATIESASPGPSAPPKVRYELARTHYFLGIGHPPPGPPPGGPGHGPPFARRERGEPGPPRVPGAEQEHMQQATAMFSELAEQFPSNPNYRHMLALCYRDGVPHGDALDRDATASAFDKATHILEQLVHDFPDVPDYRYDLSKTYAMPDFHRPPSDQNYAASELRLRKALSIAEQLAAEYPHIPLYAVSLAHIYHRLGDVLRRSDRLDEAELFVRKAVALQSSLVNQFPKVPSYLLWLAVFRNSLANVLVARGQLKEARSLLEDTVATLTSLQEKNPDLWFVHGMLGRSYRSLASVLHQSGGEELALKAEQQADEQRAKMRAARPGGPAGNLGGSRE